MTSAIIAGETKKDRFAHFDAMRGWAAVLVVFIHGIIALDYALLTGRPIDSRAPWDIWISGIPLLPFGAGGSFAVCIFFALSGFVLTHAYLRSRQNLPALVTRRYVRLGIPMLAGCLLSWMLLALGLMRPHPAALITHSTWLGDQFHQKPEIIAAVMEPIKLLSGFLSILSSTYDSSLWTMPIEAGGSLVLMTIFVFLRRAGRHSERVAGYVFCLLTVVGIGTYFSLFAFGAALRVLRPGKIFVALGNSREALVILVVLGLFFGTVPFSVERWAIYNWLADLANHAIWNTWLLQRSPETFWHGIGAALIFLAVACSASMQSALSRPIGRFLGRISFPLYVLHVPILMVIECHAILICDQIGLPPFAGALVSLAAFVVAAVSVAAILTPLVEGGAIALSSLAGKVVDMRTKQVAAQVVTLFGFSRRSATRSFPEAK
jgi:peptidoglycan/LPS O-acetylase OafA/YrhL